MSPYRQPHTPEPTDAAVESADRCPDRELAPMLLLAWVISMVRVVHGLLHHETFGTEGTLAFLAIFIVPYLMKDAILWAVRRALHRRQH